MKKLVTFLAAIALVGLTGCATTDQSPDKGQQSASAGTVNTYQLQVLSQGSDNARPVKSSIEADADRPEDDQWAMFALQGLNYTHITITTTGDGSSTSDQDRQDADTTTATPTTAVSAGPG